MESSAHNASLSQLPRIVLPLNASRRGRGRMFKAANNMCRQSEPVSLRTRLVFYTAATILGGWLAYGTAWKGW